MIELLRPEDSVERQRDKLVNICSALMRRVEQAPSDTQNAYAQFERAALLDAKVRERTAELEHALDLLNKSNAKLADANREIETARSYLNEAIESVDEGLALFDAQDNLVLFNSRFCTDLADVVPRLRPGLSFLRFVGFVSRSEALYLPDPPARADWFRRRMARHAEDRVVFNLALTDNRWMQVSEHRTHDGGTVILQTDITAVMRAQKLERAQLVDSQSKMLRATLDHLAQGVCIFDRKGCLVGWNLKLEQMVRLPSPGRVRVGLRFARILDMMEGRMTFADARGRPWLQSWSEQEDGRDPISFELIGNQGQIFNVFAQEMPDEGFVISFTDITAERNASEAMRNLNRTLEHRVAERTEELGLALNEAERANESKNRFVAAASHDLLQPLSAAKLYMATIQDMDVDGEAIEVSQKATNALRNAEDIIEALLDISKLDAGKATFDVRSFALGPMLGSIVSEMMPAAARKGLRLRFVPTSLTVTSDPVFFRRILQNLIGNAIRYTDQGHVLIGVRRRPGGRACIEVHDTGRGIRREDQERIFQEFARVEASRSGSEGIGLGLAIVERACASLGHGLSLRSNFGSGSCFSVGVEHAGALPEPAARDPQSTDPLEVLRGLVVLLVENDPDLAQAMTLKCEGWGAHVLQCNNGEAAQKLLAEIELVPDVMLLDYQLGAGGITGLDLCAALRRSYGAIPALVISANRGAELQDKCRALDVPLLNKPLDTEKLRGVLARICA
ncbi:MAG: PAS-domain containing protein [Pseudomonadota bacterium]